MPPLADAWARLWRCPVAVLATNGPDGHPHLVPCCFALDGPELYSAVDDKPKSSSALRRFTNIASDDRVTILADHYEDEWERLWWIRAAGTGRRVDEDGERARAVALLRAKYPNYAGHSLDGPMLAVRLTRWRGWAWT
jgi:PPOX class probable F420-dependent enzyme